MQRGVVTIANVTRNVWRKIDKATPYEVLLEIFSQILNNWSMAVDRTSAPVQQPWIIDWRPVVPVESWLMLQNATTCSVTRELVRLVNPFADSLSFDMTREEKLTPTLLIAYIQR